MNPGDHGLWPTDYVTIVNTEKKQRSIQFNNMTWYPDIVIMNTKNEVRELGEVATSDEIQPQIMQKWRGYASAASLGPKGYPKLFIYVPSTKQQEARKLLDESKLRYAGLRTYQVSPDSSITINEIVTYDP